MSVPHGREDIKNKRITIEIYGWTVESFSASWATNKIVSTKKKNLNPVS